MHKKKTHILFVFILVLALFLRLYKLSSVPPALNWDEVSHGYNAYSILKTGKDEWGKLFPITNFRAYGDYPLPLNLYLTIPSIALLGLNEFSIRLPHAILGVLTTAAVFFLTYGLTKKKNIALLASFLVAINPWSLFTSRFVIQANLSIFFLTAGMSLFFNRLKNKYFLPLSFLCLGLTLFSYHTTRIFTPLLLLALLYIYRADLNKFLQKEKIAPFLSIVILLIFFLSLPFILAQPEARARSSEVFIIDAGAVGKIIANRNSSNLSPLLTRIMYNRPVYFIKAFSKNYVQYFSPKFLFLSGGTQYQFSIPDSGLLFPVSLPFFYVGLVFIIKSAISGKKNYQLVLAWLLLAPVPASVTKESYAVLRSTTLLPLPDVFAALGFFIIVAGLARILGKRNKSALYFGLTSVYVAALLVALLSYLNKYFGEYTKDYSWAWQYGYKQVVAYAKENYSKYDKIIVTKKYGEPHEFFLFFWSWDPGKYQNDPNLIRFYQSNWYWVDRFDKFYFVNDWDIPKEEWQDFALESRTEFGCASESCLLITSPDNYPKSWNKVETVNFLDNQPAFEIYEN